MAPRPECEHCDAPLPADADACSYCGTPTPAYRAQARMRSHLRTLGNMDELLVQAPPAFLVLHGSIFFLVGLGFTLTVIGAIVGIPAMWFGVTQWRRAWRGHQLRSR